MVHTRTAPCVLSRARAVITAGHPVEMLAITALTTVLAVQAAPHGIAPVLTAPAVLAGLLSIGWSNDALDAPRDAAAGRMDKPVATGVISVFAVWIAAFAGLLAALAMSLAIGVVTAIILAVIVGVISPDAFGTRRDREHAANVRRWRDGQMALRWCAAGMIEASKQFRRVNGHLHLTTLRAALEREIAESVGLVVHNDQVNVA